MRLSRPCYDKSARCPGWAGGGDRYAQVQTCDSGHIKTKDGDHPGTYPWRFGYCDTCDVVTWPVRIRQIDWRRYYGNLRFWFKYLR